VTVYIFLQGKSFYYLSGRKITVENGKLHGLALFRRKSKCEFPGGREKKDDFN
jgi:hypothetical protein